MIRELFQLCFRANPKDLFNITVSDRLGTTSSKEQYAYMYRYEPAIVKVEGTVVVEFW